ncbi:hypothetical protein QYE76_023771 [Lolium multiflorum]|uniref:Small nuclear ribonucleoprotein Sm D3 n=1 Tax=Lolium multiflorum TaxID=4521 RepID=A0AAD8RF41_LOLMU|nr:hypothetical protein QYE76_023771 [Lolium multiflorum]
MSRSLGIPVKLLHEAAGHVVTVELKTGEVYRGSMIECEDNWNCQIENITFTAKVHLPLLSPLARIGRLRFSSTHDSDAALLLVLQDGKVSQLEHVFIRGSRVRFMIIPDMLKNAPMFKRLEARIRGKGSAIGVGRGRAVAMRARNCFMFSDFVKRTTALLRVASSLVTLLKEPVRRAGQMLLVVVEVVLPLEEDGAVRHP